MKDKILNALTAVQVALNNVTVCGETNCLNLGGAIQMLREVTGALEKSTITPPETDAQKGADTK